MRPGAPAAIARSASTSITWKPPSGTREPGGSARVSRGGAVGVPLPENNHQPDHERLNGHRPVGWKIRHGAARPRALRRNRPDLTQAIHQHERAPPHGWLAQLV